MDIHDKACALYEREFGRRAMISKREAAQFLGCSVKTIDRNLAAKFVQTPGGVRIMKPDVIAEVR